MESIDLQPCRRKQGLQQTGCVDVDGEIIVDEEDGNLAAFPSGPSFQQE